MRAYTRQLSRPPFGESLGVMRRIRDQIPVARAERLWINLPIGYTLNQRALANHLFASIYWVRSRGELVTRHGETWARMEYSNHRCAGYKLVTRS